LGGLISPRFFFLFWGVFILGARGLVYKTIFFKIFGGGVFFFKDKKKRNTKKKTKKKKNKKSEKKKKKK
ncbi:hypothetical protein, partial [Neokomagataea anthophila]